MAAMNLAEGIFKRAARAKQMINRYFPDDTYHITFSRYGGFSPRTEIGIYNKDLLPPTNKEYNPYNFYCIQCEIVDEKPTILHVGSLKQCGLNGTTHLEKIIAFAQDYGFSEITLQDASSIVYTIIDTPTIANHVVDLQKLLRLMTGRSWYEKFGFTNDNIERRIKDIEKDIKQPIRIYPQELIDRIQDTITLTIDLDVDKNISISEAASYLYKCLITECPERKCLNHDNIYVIDDINSILDEMYQGMLSRLNMEEHHFYDLHLIFPPRNQKGSSRKTRGTRRQQNKKVRTALRNQKRRTQRHT
jgi:hypothetical protein